MNIQDFNQAVVSDAYLLSLQSDITAAIAECRYISVMNSKDFFYQWQVIKADQEKFMIVSHWKLKTFNVVLISYKKSFFYSQWMIDKILQSYRDFAQLYINDLIIFLKILKNYKKHFSIIFFLFNRFEISLNKIKTYFRYLFIIFLDQQMNKFSMIISEKWITVIQELKFLKTLKNFEIYLNLINWLHQYIFYYAQLIKSLQNKKTALFHKSSIAEKSQKKYSKKTWINESSILKHETFKNIQKIFDKFNFFHH